MAGHVSPRHRPLFFPPTTFAGVQTRLLLMAKRLALPALCLGGFALRLHLLSAYPFREDEAMYSVWARHLWQVDPLALTVWPDKPPLYLWLLGGVFQLFGPSEAAARLLNIAADTLTIGVVAATGRVLWNSRAGLFAGLGYALSPFAISFAPTAYTDPTLVLWGMLALYTSLTRRAFWAGLFLAAAIATKQQGLLYAPLVLTLLFLTTKTQRHKEEEEGKRQKGKAKVSARQSTQSQFAIRYSPFAILLFGFALLTLPVLFWDASRWAVAPSPWDLSVRNYAPLTFLPPENWLPRLIQWGEVAWNLAGSWWVVGYWVLGIGYWRLAPKSLFVIRYSPFAIIFLWFLGFVALHVISSVQIWDRYLLPLAPVLALFMGWMVVRHLTGAQRNNSCHTSDLYLRTCQVSGVIALLLLLPPALTAASGGLPVGADHGDYAGLNESIDWLRKNAPTNAIIYHRDVSWQLRFAFFAATPEQPEASDFELRWFPNAVYLADNAAKTPERRKFLIEPTWAAVDSAAQRLSQRAIGWQPRLRAGNFTLYELTRPPATPCDWCLCAEQTQRALPDWLAKPASQHLIIPSRTQP